MSCGACAKARSVLPSAMRQKLEKIERDRAARRAAKIKTPARGVVIREGAEKSAPVSSDANSQDGMPPDRGLRA